MPNEKESRFILIALAFAILFGIWFFSIKEVFSPFLLSLIIIAFMLPFREHKSIRVLIALVFTIFMVWLFYYLQDIVSPFLISFALAYLFNPVVELLERKKISRTFSILIITFIILGSLALFGLLVIPQLAEEVKNLTASLPSYEEIKEKLQTNSFAFLDRFGIDANKLMQTIQSETSQKINEIIKFFTQSALSITTGLSSLITQLINVILIPFVTFYFLRDFDKNIRTLKERTPARHRALVDKIYTRVNTILSLYIRGKILAAGIITVITWAVLALFGINFALIIGMTTGFMSLIPYVGPIFAFIIGAVLGLLNPSPETAVLKIMLVIGVIQILDTAIISPKVVGEKLGLHPVLMIFSLFVFAKIWGMIGLLISIPLTAILKVFIMEWYEQDFMKKELFGDETGKAKD